MADIQTFGYAEHRASTLWLATSSGRRRRYSERLGKVEITAKTPDFSRSSWAGTATADFTDVRPDALFERLAQRLSWAAKSISLPAGRYEVVLEPSATADLAIAAYELMTRRDADEGRSPFSAAGGGARLGERMFGHLTLYSDPAEPGIPALPFHATVDSGSASSVFDNGLDMARTEWVRDGVLTKLVTPRYWAAKTAVPEPVPYVDNLVVSGGDASLDDMIARTSRGLLVTCFWYIRNVDPQTALMTGLTRDGVFLVEHGRVVGAVNNFRWNMSPIAAFADATEMGRAVSRCRASTMSFSAPRLPRCASPTST
jgi:predicted Zn-dependent protease